MEFEFSPKVLALRQQLLTFMDEYVYPNDTRHDAELAVNAKAGRPYAELPMVAG
jgi:acyl-CoA dehydrogenase